MSEELKNIDHEIEETPEKRDFEEELLQLLQSNEPPEQLKADLGNYHDNDIAAVLPKLTKAERLKLYKVLGVSRDATDDEIKNTSKNSTAKKPRTSSKAWTRTTLSTFSTNSRTIRKKRFSD